MSDPHSYVSFLQSVQWLQGKSCLKLMKYMCLSDFGQRSKNDLDLCYMFISMYSFSILFIPIFISQTSILVSELNSGQLVFKYVFSTLFQSKRLLKYDTYMES